MTFTLTATEMSEITGMSAEQCGEIGSDSAIRDRHITKAIRQFQTDAQRTFTGSESDASDAKDAVAFLSAHLISRTQVRPIAEGNYRSPYLEEYKRLLKMLKNKTEDSNERYWAGLAKVYETVDLDDNYKEDGKSEES